MVPNATCPICRSERRREVWEWEEGKGGGVSRRICRGAKTYLEVDNVVHGGEAHRAEAMGVL